MSLASHKKRIENFLDVDKNRNLSESWIGFHLNYVIGETPLKGYNKPGVDWWKLQTGSPPDHIAWRIDNNLGKWTCIRETDVPKEQEPKCLKQNKLVLILREKDRILCSITTWYTNSFEKI